MSHLVDTIKEKLTTSHSQSPSTGAAASSGTASSTMSGLPKTYKAAVFEEKGGKLMLRERELQLPKRGEVLVKVLATGVCASDTHVQNEDMGPTPRVPGHETIGDVVAVPEDGSEDIWKVGDRVGAPWHGGHCGFCLPCKKGNFQMCEQAAVNGVTRDGGYAEYVLLRREAVVRVPKDVDPQKYAPILCAGVTVFNSLRQQKLDPGSLVAVQGLGGLGHLAIQYAKAQGYRVVALSSSADKEKFARDLGAEFFIDGSKGDTVEQLNKLGGVSCIITTINKADLVSPLINALSMQGKLLILAPSLGKVEFETSPLIMKGVSITGWPSGHAVDSEEALEFAKAKGIKVMTEVFTLDQANEAYQSMMDGKVRFRAVIAP